MFLYPIWRHVCVLHTTDSPVFSFFKYIIQFSLAHGTWRILSSDQFIQKEISLDVLSAEATRALFSSLVFLSETDCIPNSFCISLFLKKILLDKNVSFYHYFHFVYQSMSNEYRVKMCFYFDYINET